MKALLFLNLLLFAAISASSNATTENPSLTSEKPSLTTENPSLTSEKSSLTTEKPSLTTENPSSTTEKPSLTCDKKLVNTVHDPQVQLWENATVPYIIDSNFTGRDWLTIHRAFGILEKYTCVRFRSKTDADEGFLHIMNKQEGCISTVGFNGSEQFSVLQSPKCTSRIGIVLHEMMHVLGFFHEHSRWDRDENVDVIWDRIKSDSCGYFTKRGANSSFTFGMPYDFGSVLHYSSFGFSINEKPTLVAKDPKMQPLMGQRSGLSRIDILRINKVYSCPNKDPGEDKIYT